MSQQLETDLKILTARAAANEHLLFKHLKEHEDEKARRSAVVGRYVFPFPASLGKVPGWEGFQEEAKRLGEMLNSINKTGPGGSVASQLAAFDTETFFQAGEWDGKSGIHANRVDDWYKNINIVPDKAGWYECITNEGKLKKWWSKKAEIWFDGDDQEKADHFEGTVYWWRESKKTQSGDISVQICNNTDEFRKFLTDNKIGKWESNGSFTTLTTKADNIFGLGMLWQAYCAMHNPAQIDKAVDILRNRLNMDSKFFDQWKNSIAAAMREEFVTGSHVVGNMGWIARYSGESARRFLIRLIESKAADTASVSGGETMAPKKEIIPFAIGQLFYDKDGSGYEIRGFGADVVILRVRAKDDKHEHYIELENGLLRDYITDGALSPSTANAASVKS